jgi:hypothetical protein
MRWPESLGRVEQIGRPRSRWCLELRGDPQLAVDRSDLDQAVLSRQAGSLTRSEYGSSVPRANIEDQISATCVDMQVTIRLVHTAARVASGAGGSAARQAVDRSCHAAPAAFRPAFVACPATSSNLGDVLARVYMVAEADGSKLPLVTLGGGLAPPSIVLTRQAAVLPIAGGQNARTILGSTDSAVCHGHRLPSIPSEAYDSRYQMEMPVVAT